MPTANWLTAAKQENRKPVVLMQIEDSSAEEQLYTTRSDWEGSVTITNVDTTSQVGSVIGQYQDEADSYSLATSGNPEGTLFFYWRSVLTPTFDTTLNTWAISSLVYYLILNQNRTRTVTFNIRTGGHGGTVVFTTSQSLLFINSGPNLYNKTASNISLDVGLELTSGTSYYFEATTSDTTSPSPLDTIGIRSQGTTTHTLVPVNSIDCTLTTSTIDIGYIPANPVLLSIDDTLEAGSTIIYTAFGGNADPPVTNLGTVSDGDSLTAYRYYRLQADFASTTGGRGILKQFGLREGLFKWYGTHQDLPFRGVKPYLELESLSNLSSAIKLDKGISTTGQMTAVLKWTSDVSDFIASRYLRGKDVQFLYGFQELAQSDYEPIFTGTWFDYSFDDIKQTVSVKIQDILKQFEKVKLPTEEYNSSGVKTSTDIVYTKANGVNTISNIFDLIGIRDRYISSEYATLEAGVLSSTDYNVTRTLSKPIEAKKLLDELAQTLGLFLVPQGDGVFYPNLYDDAAAAAYTIDASKFTPSAVAGNQDTIATRQYAYYNITSSSETDPNSEDKFDNAYQLINAGSEAKWENEKSQKLFFDKWRIGNNQTDPLTTGVASPPQALIDLADRWNGWYSDPKFTVTFSNLPPQWFKVNPSDIVEINNLTVPVTNQAWDNVTDYAVADIIINDGVQYESIAVSGPSTTIYEPGTTVGWESFWSDMNILDTGLTDGMKFITMKRNIDIKRGSVTLEFRQI